MSKKAFTLIEVILVITIVAILAAITLPRLGGRDFFMRLTLRTTAHQVASDIRYTRRLAITDAEKYIIKFWPARHEYGIYREAVDYPDNANLTGEIKEIPLEISMYFSNKKKFTFERLGNAAVSGILNLKTGANEEYQYDIIVEPVTGSAITERIS